LLAELGSDGRLGEVELMPGALTCLRGLTELLDQVRGRLAKIAWQLRGQLERDPLARRLDGIPGFGLILSPLLKAEIGVIERFRHHRALAAYSLLAPISDDTGEDDGSKPIGRHLGCRGNATLKWAFLEAAHGAVKTGGKWRRIFDSATEGGTKNRGRGYIKVARELVKVVYVVWRKGVEYTDTPPARPGWQPGGLPRERMKNFLSSTRSGTGQPLHPMAVVH
jgi:transposase